MVEVCLLWEIQRQEVGVAGCGAPAEPGTRRDGLAVARARALSEPSGLSCADVAGSGEGVPQGSTPSPPSAALGAPPLQVLHRSLSCPFDVVLKITLLRAGNDFLGLSVPRWSESSEPEMGLFPLRVRLVSLWPERRR